MAYINLPGATLFGFPTGIFYLPVNTNYSLHTCFDCNTH